jgi:hypothetical protein
MIDPAAIPQFTGDEDAIERAADALVKAARGIAHVGASVDRSWQGMTAVYEAPEASTLLAASAPIRDRAAELGDDIEAVAQALRTYAAEVRPIAHDLRFETSIIENLVERWRTDPEWREEDINVSEHNNTLRRIDGYLAALMAAERKAANTINALIGMPQYHQAGAEGPEEYTYGFDPAQVDPNAERPWGDPVEEDSPGGGMPGTRPTARCGAGCGTERFRVTSAVWPTSPGSGARTAASGASAPSSIPGSGSRSCTCSSSPGSSR